MQFASEDKRKAEVDGHHGDTDPSIGTAHNQF